MSYTKKGKTFKKVNFQEGNLRVIQLSFNNQRDWSYKNYKTTQENVIVHSTPAYHEFISGIFIKKKKDKNKRMISNLKLKLVSAIFIKLLLFTKW